LRQQPASAVVLAEDETILRLFPPLRSAWALRGEQAQVPISGHNDQQTLFGAINLKTGRRVLMVGSRPNQAEFQVFLRELRRHYPSRPICLLLDKATNHTAKRSQALAQALGITLIWLPHQAPELNAADQLWKELKREMMPNHQFEPVERAAEYALTWVRHLTNGQSLAKSGVRSRKYWLKGV
jgi:transposase